MPNPYVINFVRLCRRYDHFQQGFPRGVGGLKKKMCFSTYFGTQFVQRELSYLELSSTKKERLLYQAQLHLDIEYHDGC